MSTHFAATWLGLDSEFYNFEIYIGNDPAYSTNSKCPGGPYMTGSAGETNYAWTTDPFKNEQAWSWGIEVWCNMQGRYVHLVADMSARSNW